MPYPKQLGDAVLAGRADLGSTRPLKEAELGGHKDIVKMLKARKK